MKRIENFWEFKLFFLIFHKKWQIFIGPSWPIGRVAYILYSYVMHAILSLYLFKVSNNKIFWSHWPQYYRQILPDPAPSYSFHKHNNHSGTWSRYSAILPSLLGSQRRSRGYSKHTEWFWKNVEKMVTNGPKWPLSVRKWSEMTSENLFSLNPLTLLLSLKYQENQTVLVTTLNFETVQRCLVGVLTGRRVPRSHSADVLELSTIKLANVVALETVWNHFYFRKFVFSREVIAAF